jgi:hypothetical protein
LPEIHDPVSAATFAKLLRHAGSSSALDYCAAVVDQIDPVKHSFRPVLTVDDANKDRIVGYGGENIYSWNLVATFFQFYIK